MYSSTYLKWFRRLLILGAVVAGFTASAAGARLDPGTPPDVSDVAFRLSAAPATDVARPPDVRDAAGSVSPATADAFERYASTHPYGFGLASGEFVPSPPDVQDAAAALHVTAQGLEADGLRWQGLAQAYQQGGTSDPVTRILAQERGRRLDQGSFAASTPSIEVVESGGFDWNDYAIGIGSGMGLILLAAGLTMGIRLQRGHPVQSA